MTNGRSLRLAAAALVTGLAALGCDPWVCAPKSCANGQQYQQCTMCGTGGTQCTYQARDDRGSVLRECSYQATNTMNDPGRTACSDQTNAAGRYWCETGTTNGGGGGR